MKIVPVLPILLFIAVSCNKETKTVTKTDPATGKTVTVEVPVGDSLQVAEQPVQRAAIYDSAGVYYQTFQLEKGQTYPLTTHQKDVQTVTGPDGKSQSGTSESTDQMSFVINDVKDGIYDVTVNLLGKKSSQSANGKSVVIDTKAAEPKEDQLKMIWKVNKALVGNQLKMKMDQHGKVLSITGFDPIYNKVSAALGSIIKDQKEKNAFMKNFKEGFNQKILTDQFAKNLSLLPKKGVKIGQNWTESENASPDGKIKLSTTYTLKSVDNGVATIAVAGGIPYKSDKRTQEGITRSMSSELSQNGTITLDEKTGWIRNQKIAVKTAQSETLSDGKQTQTMKSVSNSTVSVNP